MADDAFFRAHTGIARVAERHPWGASGLEVVTLFAALMGITAMCYLHYATDNVIATDAERCVGNFSLGQNNLLQLQLIPPWLENEHDVDAWEQLYATSFMSMIDLTMLNEGDLLHQHLQEDVDVQSSVGGPADDLLSWSQLRRKLLREFQFVYSRERSLLFVKKATREQLGVQTQKLNLTASCFDNAVLHQIFSHIGYDTFANKLLAHLFNDTGAVYVFSEGEVLNLNTRRRFDGWDWIDEIIHRCLLLVIAFVSYLISDLAVGVALIESQIAILRFVLILRARQRYPAFLEGCKVFAFIILLLGACVVVGDLLEDRLVAVLAIAVFWASKVYTSIGCRCFEARVVYPITLVGSSVIYFIYCMAFGEQGFVYLGCLVWASILTATVVILLLRFEIPALRSGEINAQNVRWRGF